ncbi:MAG: class I SAM-dependent methyltransferase [Actinobacteria bacterium]|nr:class I SAM-dependent methyltransferase [Actinomycetota bacterium]
MSSPPLTLNAWLRYDVVRRLLTTTNAKTVVEFGAGRGAVGARLSKGYEYTGIEPDERSRAVAQQGIHRGTMLADLSQLTAHKRFDVACAFEVLEHIEDDVGALQAWREHLSPGGHLILSVPALQERFAAADHIAGHFRRYDPDVLTAVLTKAGYVEPKVVFYGFPFGYLLEWGRNTIAKRSRKSGPIETRTAASGRWLQPPDWLGWATRASSFPFRVLQRIFPSRGTGLIAVARRPS